MSINGVETPVKWAFGSGEQAITPVIGRDGKWIEHRVSWYRDGNRLGLTPGHDPAAPDLTGVEQTPGNAARCFGCHTTGGVPGVQCRACHGSAEHPAKPARTVALCAQCHRSPDIVFASEMPEVDDPLSVRFAPVGFLASRCSKASPAFTCVDCHDPHGEKRIAVDAVCSSCHVTRPKACAPQCASCHMPKASPAPGLHFTDHRIRIP